MSNWSKWLWGGMGWAMFGPIGGIMGYALGSMSENTAQFNSQYTKNINNAKTQGGDFGSALLILFAAVMKADNQLKKSELAYIKTFFIQQFGKQYAQDRILLFQEILPFFFLKLIHFVSYHQNRNDLILQSSNPYNQIQKNF